MLNCKLKFNGDMLLENKEEEIETLSSIESLSKHFPILANNLQACTNNDKLLPIQYLMSKIMIDEYEIFKEQQDDSWIVILSPPGTGKTLTYLMPVFEKTNELIRKNCDKTCPIALIFTSNFTAVDTIYKQFKDLIGLLDIEIAKCCRGVQEAPMNKHILICTHGSFTTHFPDLNVFQNIKYVVVDEMDEFLKEHAQCQMIEELYQISDCKIIFGSATNNAYCGRLIETYKKNHFVIKYDIESNNEYKFYEVASKSIPKTLCFSRFKIDNNDQEKGNPNPFDLTLKILQNEVQQNEQVIIFIKRKEMIDRVAYPLLHLGYKVVTVHSDHSADIAKQCLDAFQSGKANILLSSQACTRGFDSKNVKHVINYDLPLDYKDYIHQTGRTGRNNQKGTIHTFIDFNNHVDYSPEVINAIAQNIYKKIDDGIIERDAIASFFLEAINRFVNRE